MRVCPLISETIKRLSWQEKLNYKLADDIVLIAGNGCPLLMMLVNWILFLKEDIKSPLIIIDILLALLSIDRS